MISYYCIISNGIGQCARSYKRYAIALKFFDKLVGMVGMGLEDTLNEVEAAYFMSEKYQRKGYTKHGSRHDVYMTDLYMELGGVSCIAESIFYSRYET